MADHTGTVAQIYEAFGRGDINFIVDQLADDVSWESFSDWTPHKADVPWLASGRGKDAALRFFGIIGTWEFTDFKVLDLLASGTQVAAEIEVGTKHPSGAILDDEEMHLWSFNEDGKISRFRHYVDTAKHIAAAGVAVGA
jgi:uncharacterized protein